MHCRWDNGFLQPWSNVRSGKRDCGDHAEPDQRDYEYGICACAGCNRPADSNCKSFSCDGKREHLRRLQFASAGPNANADAHTYTASANTDTGSKSESEPNSDADACAKPNSNACACAKPNSNAEPNA
jgi:hypothetical protein